MEKVSFDSIISDKTSSEIIWKGKYGRIDCVIKMILLNTGIHYDRNKNKYYNLRSKISKSKGRKYFKRNHDCPFFHDKYHMTKAVGLDKFYHEVKMLKGLNDIGVAPELYHYWIDQSSYGVHYGFIVMEPISTTVKDILEERDLLPREDEYIQSKIDKLHNNNIECVDLTSGNIGVNLDDSGYINHVCIIDCSKASYNNNIGTILI